jgi:hypothetical protein
LTHTLRVLGLTHTLKGFEGLLGSVALSLWWQSR